MTWRNRARRGGRRAWEYTRSSGARVQRVVEQKAAQAKQKGRDLARRVIGAQLSAGMDSDRKTPFLLSTRDLMRRSAETTVLPEGDKAWREGYRDVAKEFVPSVGHPAAPEPARPAPWPGRPELDSPEAGQ